MEETEMVKKQESFEGSALRKHFIRVCDDGLRVPFGRLERDPKQAPRDSSRNNERFSQVKFKVYLTSDLTQA